MYYLIWPIRGCATGQSMIFVLSVLTGYIISCASVLNREYKFVQVCPHYEKGVACTIDLICLMKFVCTSSIQNQ